MSAEEKTTWTCDYGTKTEVTRQSADREPMHWVRGAITWNEHYKMKVDLCPECFGDLFHYPNPRHPRPTELKKPFWQKFFKKEAKSE